VVSADDDVLEHVIKHTDSIKCLISGDGSLGGAVHMHCTCVVTAVEEVRSRLRAARSRTSSAYKVIGILNAKVSEVTCVILSFGVVTVQC